MQLPVNVGEVFKIATDMKEVAETPISVSIYIDDTAPGALVGHVRSAFASSGEHTRVTIDYLDEDPVAVKRNEDMGVIIAGESERIGEEAQRLRDAGVPAMVVCDSPKLVENIANASGHPIPAADVIAPIKLESKAVGELLAKLRLAKPKGDAAVAGEGAQADIMVIGDDANIGEIALDDDAFKALDVRMGKWIVSACKGKDLAFALSFPFIRRPLADDSITATSLQNGAVGLVPFIPGADMPIMTLNQIKMVLQIATAYGQPLDKERVKEIAVVVGGAFVCRNIVRSATKVVPFAGWIISGTIGFAATEAMGHAMVEYFEAGGDMVGVASVIQTARDTALATSKKAADSPLGKSIVNKAKEVASDLAAHNA